MRSARKISGSNMSTVVRLEDNESANGVEELPVAVETREDRIRLAAYLAAERRGFAPGYETEDWIAAEQEVDAASGTEQAEGQLESGSD